MKKYLKVKDLKKVLEDFDDELYLCVTRRSKGDSFGISKEDIFIDEAAYFGNDSEMWDTISIYDEEIDDYETKPCLNIGYA